MPPPKPAAIDQIYVAHCAAGDSVLNNPGYSVRAASVAARDPLEDALRYPPYELPIDLWRNPPDPADAPRRLARTRGADGRVWLAHSVYLPKDSTGRDRAYFTHILLVPELDPARALRAWGGKRWAADHAPGAPKQLPPAPDVPAGTLVGDEALAAFLGGTGAPVCPPRLRASAAVRRDLLARFLRAVIAARGGPAPARLFVHAEPALLALLLYGAVRLLPQLTADLTFSTFEPAHKNLSGYRLADVVGTYIGPPTLGKGLPPELARAGVALDTVFPPCSSPELIGDAKAGLPAGVLNLIDLAAQNDWLSIEELLELSGGGEWDPLAGAPSPAAPGVPAAPRVAPLPPEPGPAAPTVGGTYSAQISRTNPACFLFLVDQSKSMGEPFVGGNGQTKAAVVADALNRLLQNLVLRSAKADGVRDYFRVGVIGYGARVAAGFGGAVPLDVLRPISRLANHPLRVEARTRLVPDGAGGLVEQAAKFPVWFDPEAGGSTPMCAAMEIAKEVVSNFVRSFPDAYPPMVLNLTDGLPTDGNPQVHARGLREQRTADGHALLFNLLISSHPVPADYFPATEEHLPDVASKLAFRMSSVLPEKLREAARAEGHAPAVGARGVVANADPTAVVRFLDIGTRVTPSGR